MKKPFLKNLLFLLLVLAAFSWVLAQATPTRDDLIAEIKKLADDFASADASWIVHWNTVRDFIEQKDTGKVLTVNEIEQAYREEFTRAKEAAEPGLLDKIGVNPLVIVAALAGVIVTLLVTKLGNAIWGFFSNRAEQGYRHVAGNKFMRRYALRRYQNSLIKKYKVFQSSIGSHTLQLQNIYVPLKAIEVNEDNPETENRLQIIMIDPVEAVQKYSHLIITGEPGAGKSILTKFLTLKLAQGQFYDGIPVLIELRDFSRKSTLTAIDHIVDAFKTNDFPNAESFVKWALENNLLTLLLDGFDEVGETDRMRVATAIHELGAKKCRVVITCRNAVYHDYHAEFREDFDNHLQIEPFSDQQIQQFLDAWTNSVATEIDTRIKELEDNSNNQRELADLHIRQQRQHDKPIEQLFNLLHVDEKAYLLKLARNPLLLTIIAYLYTDTNHILPQSRVEFYDLAADELFRRRQDLNHFDAPQKRSVLQHLALFNQEGADDRDRRSIDYQKAIQQVGGVLKLLNLSETDAKDILDEIVERTGLLIFIDEDQRFQFAHLTLQEYFAASKLLNDSKGLIQRYRMNPDTWREVVKLWCGKADDSNTVIEGIYEFDPIMAFECLADALSVDAVLANTIFEGIKGQLGNGDNKTTQAFAAVASDRRPNGRGKIVYDYLGNMLSHSDINIQNAAVEALGNTNLPDAAKLLATFYPQPNVRSALIQMSDVAIPLLSELIANGVDLIPMIDDLRAIGTPKASQQLLSIFYKVLETDPTMSTRVAWALATLLYKPEIKEVLRNYHLTPQQKKLSNMDYVWRPFEDNEPVNSSLPIIVGQIAFIIQLSIDGNPYDTPAHEYIIVPSLITKLENEKFSLPPGYISIPQEFEPEFAPLRKSLFSRTDIDKEGIVEVISNNVHSLSPKFSGWFMDTFCFTNPNIHNDVKNLVSTLKPDLRWTLIAYMASKKPFVRENWLTLNHPSTYSFEYGYHFKFIRLLTVILSLFSLLKIVQLIIDTTSPNPINVLLIVLGILIILVIFNIMFPQNRTIGEDNNDGGTFLLLVLLGFLTAPLSLYLDIKDRSFKIFDYLLNVAGFIIYPIAPVILVSNMINEEYQSLVVIALFWILLLVPCILIWLLGQKQDRIARNPLRNIIPLETGDITPLHRSSRKLWFFRR